MSTCTDGDKGDRQHVFSRPVDYSTCNIWLKLTHTWGAPFLRKGKKSGLDIHDALPLLSTCDTADAAVQSFEEHYSQERKQQHAPAQQRAAGQGRNGFQAAILRAHVRDLLTHSVWAVLEMLFRVLSPLALRLLIRWLADYEDPGVATNEGEGWAWAVLVAMFGLGLVLAHHQLFWVGMRTGFHMKQQAIAAVQDKLLRLNGATLGHLSAGQIVNLVSNDVRRFDDFGPFWVFSWAGPLEALVVLLMISLELGFVPAIAGVGTLLLVIPLQGKLAGNISALRTQAAAQTDERVRLTGELLEGAMSVKMLTWEEPFQKLLHAIRAAETRPMWRMLMIEASSMALMFFCVPVASFVAFATAVGLGDTLQLESVFYVVALLHLPKLWLALFFVKAVKSISETRVAMRRINAFLTQPEARTPVQPAVAGTLAGTVEMRGASFAWASRAWAGLPDAAPAAAPAAAHKAAASPRTLRLHVSSALRKVASIGDQLGRPIVGASPAAVAAPVPDAPPGGLAQGEGGKEAAGTPTLVAPAFRIEPGTLVGICGEVGSGKSSLLAALLGELQPIPQPGYQVGEAVEGSPVVTGTVAYSQQIPWIEAGTVRDNILFAAPYDEAWYDKVLRCCALEHDIRHLPHGDATEIGERGVNLSGGQKARLALARAAYSRADVCLLDDPLSAVDPRVAHTLFTQAIGPGGVMRRTTRLLVTHQTQWLHKCDRVMVVRGGRIVADGPWRDLKDRSDLPELLNANAEAHFDDAVFDDLPATSSRGGRTACPSPAASPAPSLYCSAKSSPHASPGVDAGAGPRIADVEGRLSGQTPGTSPLVMSWAMHGACAAAGGAQSGHALAGSGEASDWSLSLPSSPHQSADTPGAGAGAAAPSPLQLGFTTNALWAPASTSPTAGDQPGSTMHAEVAPGSPVHIANGLEQGTSVADGASGENGVSHVDASRALRSGALAGPRVASLALWGDGPPLHRPAGRPSGARTQRSGDAVAEAVQAASGCRYMRVDMLPTETAGQIRASDGCVTGPCFWGRGRAPVLRAGAVAEAAAGERVWDGDEEGLSVAGSSNEADQQAKDGADDGDSHRELGRQESVEDSGTADLLDPRLVKDERREIGNVSRNVYVQYIRHLGPLNAAVIFTALLLGQCAWILSEWWLSEWARATPAEQKESRWLLVYGLLVLAVVVLSLGRNLGWFSSALAAGTSLNRLSLRTVMRAPLAFFHQNPTGRILNCFSKDQGSVDEQLPQVMFDAMQTVGVVAGAAVLIAIANPTIIPVFLPLAWAFLSVRAFYLVSSREVKRFEAVTRSPVYAMFSATIKGLPTIRAYKAAPRFRAEFLAALNLNGAWWMAFLSCARWVGFRMDAISFALLSAAVVLTMAFKSLVSAGLLALALTHLLQLSGTMQWAVRQAAEAENHMTSVERILGYCDLPQERPNVADGAPPPPPGWPASAALEFDHVQARYRPGLPLVLKDLSFSLSSGSTCGVVGRTGSGKSSLMLALFDLIDITSGRVLLDGIDVASIGLDALRKQIAIIPQDPLLFSGTLRDNLDPWGSVTDHDMWGALDAVQLKGRVRELGGLDAAMHEAGVNFSAGQRQLLCLARALLADARILALDEATANVDRQTDAIIQETLHSAVKGPRARTERVMVVIAHRVGTIMGCDHLLVLADGSLVESGPPQTLAQGEGVFAQLVSAAAVNERVQGDT